MTTFTLRKGNPATTRTDAVVIGAGLDAKGVVAAAPGGEAVADAMGRAFRPTLLAAGFTGKRGESLRLTHLEGVKAGTVVVMGLGELASITPVEVRRAAGIAARSLGNAGSVALALPAANATEVGAVVGGFRSGGYSIARVGAEPKAGLSDVIVLSDAAKQVDAIAAFDAAQLIENACDQARAWVNLPPNELFPESFADAAAAYVGDTISAEVLGPKQLAALNCGGILGVGQGSANPPRLVKLTWSHLQPVARVALVGKGITFDSGGLNIKTGSTMKTMKYDMAGAASVIAATKAIAELNLPITLTTYAPMAENLPSSTAMRPGDVITMHSGKTVEVTNTDAEGRLILADALAMAAAEAPDAIFEFSTLTGACIVALGERIAGVFGDSSASTTFLEAAKATGELAWPLPLPERTIETVQTESKVADLLQANWVRWGGASYAAAFLTQFVGDVPFAHVDIAGPAFNGGGAWGDVPAGGTGYGIRSLVEAVRILVAQSTAVPATGAGDANQ